MAAVTTENIQKWFMAQSHADRGWPVDHVREGQDWSILAQETFVIGATRDGTLIDRFTECLQRFTPKEAQLFRVADFRRVPDKGAPITLEFDVDIGCYS